MAAPTTRWLQAPRWRVMAAEPGLRCGLVGFGRIGRRLAECLHGPDPAAALVAVLVRPEQATAARALAGAARVCTELGALLATEPDVVVECASAAALAATGPAVLAAGADLMPLSLAALADEATEARLMAAARAGPGRLQVPAGAMGSLGFIAAAREGGLRRVLFRAWNPPQTWAAGWAGDAPGVPGPGVFMQGSVRDVARLFPRNLNVSVGVALAGLGLDRTEAELHADPGLTQATFEVVVEAGPGQATLHVRSQPVPIGHDPADYTTYSVLRLLRRRTGRIVA